MRHLMRFEGFVYQELKDLVQQAFTAYVDAETRLCEDPETEQLGNPFMLCTYGANWVKENFFPKAKIVGYNIDDNPSALIGEFEGTGHDFLVLDNRYIIDFWYNTVHDNSAPILLDLENDTELVAKYYGDSTTWVAL